MAWRIHHSIVRGEIDNRVKNIVRGRIWLTGRAEPVTLELRGNAHPDLAGCILTFTNPHPGVPHPDLDRLHSLQQGTIGDLTASRKVRVSELRRDQTPVALHESPPAPEHLANSLYLEWFSDRNGRVVVESSNYVVNISPPQWRLTPAEEAQRAQDARAGMEGFIHKLDQVIEQHRQGQKPPEAKWDEHDYERFMRECDARTEKFSELLDKYGHSDEACRQIACEMGCISAGPPEDAPAISIEELNALGAEDHDEPPEPDPAREGIDWIRTQSGLRHPLHHRCSESALRVQLAVQALGLDRAADNDLDDFVFAFHTTAIKLAGALAGIAEGCGYSDAAFTVAYLKRALGHLHRAQSGLEAVAPKRLLPEPLLAAGRQELFAIREGILRLMDELRGRPG